MSNAKAIVAKIKQDNQELFTASRANARAYFESNPSKEELVDHFVGRMVNERMNMVEISKKVASMPASASPAELEMLAKQALDEAIHFKMVKEVIEHIAGEEINVEEKINSLAGAEVDAGAAAKGATLLDKYEASTDDVSLALYQLIAEGRAEAVWDEMADCIEDEYVSSRYARIARDEGFHSNIGAWKLEQLLDANYDAVVARVEELAPQMREDLMRISNDNTAIAA
jgi:rubrerythrin